MNQYPVLIKKYANRKYYNTKTSTYVNLSEIHSLLMSSQEVRVIENRTKTDITNKVLCELILRASYNSLPSLHTQELINQLNKLTLGDKTNE